MIYALVTLALFLVLPTASELGYKFGRSRRATGDETAKTHAVTWQGAVLALAGLLIGFTFAMAAARFDARKQIMVEESNAIGTTILRTRVLDDPQGEELRALLRQYVDARLELVAAGADRRLIDESVRSSSRLEDRIWSQVAAFGRSDPHSVATGLLMQSTNEMIDVAAKHLFALENPVPPTVFLVVILASAIAMVSIGYACGLSGARLAFGMLVMPLLLASVIALVFDIAHPRLGIVRVHHQSLLRLKQSLDDR